MKDEVSVKPKKFTYFIGIDVSRNKLDYAVIADKKLLFHKETKNQIDDISLFVNELKLLPKFTISKSVFCMEHTGIYCNHVLSTLKKLKANIVLENGLKIKNSSGLIRGKYDKIDSIRIAQYASKNRDELKIWASKRPIVQKLTNLYTVRNRLLGVQVALKTPIKEQTGFSRKTIQKDSVQSCERSLKAVNLDLLNINLSIDKLIESDDHLNKLKEIITSVPYIGPVTATQIIISTNEFKDITNPKKFACYCGIAPFKKESGTMNGRAKVSHIANKKVKSLLHICAMAAISHKGELQDYFKRKTLEGKDKMAVLNAVRYKLVLRIFACLNQSRNFERDFRRAEQN
jgi:transposase